MELMGERGGAIVMRLLVDAFRPRQWKSNIPCMFCTSSSPVGCGTKKLGQTYPTGDVSASSTGAAEEEVRSYTVIREGEAKILMPSCNSVFYNKAQVNNRDISIAVLRAFISRCKEEHATRFNINERFKNEEKEGNEGGDKPSRTFGPIVLEALAASGLRAIRYAREVDEIAQVVAIDNDKASIEICKKNIQFNGSETCSKVSAHLGDARVYMLTHPKEFDAVDLDPYGSPSIFLDSAVQTVADGGLLMCTATDLAVLCGEDGDVCYSRYGCYPLKGKYCHEMALRILLACIESHANRYKRFIVPILSVYMDYYIRVFVRVYTSPSAMKRTTLKLSYIYQCVGCDSFHLQSVGRATTKNNVERYGPAFGPTVPQACSDCGNHFCVGGPIWSDPIHDQGWVQTILEDVRSMKERYPAYDRICSVLTAISEELSDVPLFLSLHNLCGTLKCTTPSSSAFQCVVSNAGYRISGTHINPLGFKSNAPMHIIWDIMRCWIKDHPLKSRPPGEPGTIILAKEPTLLVNFYQAASNHGKARAKKTARFTPNPERNWGPKLRAGRLIKSKHVSLLGHQQTDEVHLEDSEKLNALKINGHEGSLDFKW